MPSRISVLRGGKNFPRFNSLNKKKKGEGTKEATKELDDGEESLRQVNSRL